MNTDVLDKPETGKIPTISPLDHQAQHMADVLAGRIEAAFASGRLGGNLEGETRKHIAVHTNRLYEANVLVVEIPKLESAAAELRREAERLKAIANGPFNSWSVGEWLDRLKLPADANLLAINDAIDRFRGEALEAENKADAAQRNAEARREHAVATLRATAGKAIHARAGELQDQLRGIGAKLDAGRKWLAEIGDKVAKSRLRCERLYSGERVDPLPENYLLPSPVEMFDGGRSKAAELHRLLTAERAKLAALEQEAASRPAVEREQEQLERTGAKTRAKLVSVMQEMLVVENQAWCWER